MKQKLLAFLSFLVLSTMSFSIPNVEAASYNGKSPVSTGCQNDAYTAVSTSVKKDNGTIVGTIQVKYSPSCKAAWAKTTFNSALPSGYTGNAFIHQYNSDHSIKLRSYDCNSSGGNGKVLSGQKSCYTPMVDDPVGNYAKAEGYRSTSSNPFEAYGITGYY
ncbi:hypothetical protein OKW24_003175 [Peribacillus simplex]|uniref:DUF2690 domain-containing protein n=1 Tax=Peribacillus simplex TaxID=1478 RepID=UPI0024E1EB2D|nr:DUF2690 domain-containing protein [Peribacillus simplex]MDF9761402.1 hypothetical protein [Peribacillus simplex]